MDAAKRHKREGQYGADVVSAAIQRLEEGLVVEGFVPAASFQVWALCHLPLHATPSRCTAFVHETWAAASPVMLGLASHRTLS